MLEEQELNMNIQDNNHEYSKYPIKKSNIIDVLKEEYLICCLEFIPELSNIFCKAYKVKRNNSDNTNLYALVYTKSLPLRLSVIDNLKHNPINNIISPIDYGIVKISETNMEQFVVILEKPSIISLDEYSKEHGPFSAEFITDIILIPICQILQVLHSFGIVHGNINPKNIYIDTDNKKIVLGDCVNGNTGFAQNIIYESLERAECNPMITKGDGAEHTDYFALGVTCLYLFFGHDFNVTESDDLVNQRFMYGSYKIYTRGRSIAMSIRPLIKGLVNDDLETRWQFQEIMDWYNRKQLSVVDNEDIDSNHNIMFNNNYYPNLRSLAYNMHQNWEKAKAFLKEEVLLKWLEMNSKSQQVVKLEKLLKPKIYGTGTGDKDEIIIKALCILDQYAPIRLQDCAVSLDALGVLIAYALSEKANSYVDNIRRIINMSIWNEFTELDYTEEKARELLMHLSRAKYAINKPGIGFGVERCLYELNPNLPCQSPLIAEEYITSVYELLLCIEKKAEQSSTFVIDRHIAAFLAANLGMDQRLNYKDYNKVSKRFLDHDAITILIMMAIAQEKYKIYKLSNLSAIVVEMLLPLLEMVGNYKRRQALHNNLNNQIPRGDFIKLLNIIIDTSYLELDRKEMELAEQQLASINEQIKELHDEKQCYVKGYKLGLKLCAVLSYLSCAITFIILIITKF
ncbi:Serine/Threonine kinase [Rickettsiales bacterium Ac37b]|nr:Serine/Threonine kinase [Rickettsiales bacterium Ac37b]